MFVKNTGEFPKDKFLRGNVLKWDIFFKNQSACIFRKVEYEHDNI